MDFRRPSFRETCLWIQDRLLPLLLALQSLSCSLQVNGVNTPASTPSSSPSPTGTQHCQYKLAMLASWDFSNANAATAVQNIRVGDTAGDYFNVITQLTTVPLFNPQLSSDGTFIIYRAAQALSGADSLNTNSTQNIWSMNSDGTGMKHLTSLTANTLSISTMALSPDNKTIAYLSNRKLDGTDALNANSVPNLWLINTDGTNDHPITSLTANTLSIGSLPNILWAPDSSTVYYTSSRKLDGTDALNTNSVLNIWKTTVLGAVSSPVTSMTAAGSYNNLGGITSDGSSITFWANRAADGSDAANTNSVPNIWKVALPGGTLTQLTALTAAGVNAAYPAYSADGTKIVYYSKRALDGSNSLATNSVRNIWIMNSDGTGTLPLTQLSSSASIHAMTIGSPWAFFAESDKVVIYQSNRKLDGTDALNNAGDVNNMNLWRVNVDGTNATAITKLSATSAFIGFIMAPSLQRYCFTQ